MRIRLWIREERATAFVEAALLFPVLLTLLMGMYDLGNGILVCQKTISASQMTADLLARDPSISDADINQAVEAARLALQPYSASGFGIDIASVEFRDDGTPDILCRETREMLPNEAAVNRTVGLGGEGEGLVVVTVQYRYEPLFANVVIPSITMQEEAYVRGRRSSTVICEN